MPRTCDGGPGASASSDSGRERETALTVLRGTDGVLKVRPGSSSVLLLLALDADLESICRKLENALPALRPPAHIKMTVCHAWLQESAQPPNIGKPGTALAQPVLESPAGLLRHFGQFLSCGRQFPALLDWEEILCQPHKFGAILSKAGKGSCPVRFLLRLERDSA